MRVWFACILAVLVALPSLAQERGSVRDQVESSMVLTGTIDIAADGKVSGYAIDRATRVPTGVLGLLARFVPGWRFEPAFVDGQPAAKRAYMSVRVVAKRQGEGTVAVSIRDANFRQRAPGEHGTKGNMRPPRYPHAALRAGVAGTVYTIVRIDRDGQVLDAFAEQVDLRVLASEYALVRWRELMADAALHAARQWSFPEHPDAPGDDTWVARVPVDFAIGRDEDRYGQWQAYVPGPWQPPPWTGVRLAGGPGALPASGIFPVGQDLQLLTPMGGD